MFLYKIISMWGDKFINWFELIWLFHNVNTYQNTTLHPINTYNYYLSIKRAQSVSKAKSSAGGLGSWGGIHFQAFADCLQISAPCGFLTEVSIFLLAISCRLLLTLICHYPRPLLLPWKPKQWTVSLACLKSFLLFLQPLPWFFHCLLALWKVHMIIFGPSA